MKERIEGKTQISHEYTVTRTVTQHQQQSKKKKEETEAPIYTKSLHNIQFMIVYTYYIYIPILHSSVSINTILCTIYESNTLNAHTKLFPID